MSETHGIKETKETLEAVQAVAKLIAVRMKDGFQAYEDGLAFAMALMSDAEMKQKLALAFEGYQAIPNEVKDLSIGEAIELVTVGVQGTKDVIQALRA